MADGEKYLWLKGPRERAGVTQADLAEIAGCDERLIRYWETCDPGRADGVPYQAFAERLGASEDRLRRDHQHDLRRRDARERTLGHPIDEARLAKAIAGCGDAALHRELLRALSAEDDAKAAHQLAEYLTEREMKGVSRLNLPLQRAFKRGSSEPLRIGVRGLVVAIAGAAALPAVEVAVGQRRYGVCRAWVNRLTIDAAEGLDSDWLQAGGQNQPSDAPVRAALLGGEMVVDTAPERLWEIVKQLGEIAFPHEDEPPHPLDDPVGFKTYCEHLNAELFNLRGTDEHCFAMLLKTQPPDLMTALDDYLEDLWVLDCANPQLAAFPLRVDEARLGNFIARWLRHADAGGELTSAPEPEMKPASLEAQTIIHHYGSGDVNAALGRRDATVYRNGDGVDAEALLALVREFLGQLPEQNLALRPVRNALRDIAADTEKDGAPPEEAKSWLENAMKAVTLTDKATQTGTRVLDLLARFPGLGIGA